MAADSKAWQQTQRHGGRLKGVAADSKAWQQAQRHGSRLKGAARAVADSKSEAQEQDIRQWNGGSSDKSCRLYCNHIASKHETFSDANGCEMTEKLPVLKNQITSDSNGTCATGWLYLMLTD